MIQKTYVPKGEAAPASQMGATMEALAAAIAARRGAGEESYTFRLLTGELDKPLKKLAEEAVEVCLAAKDAATAEGARADAHVDHLRYEAADVVYHLMVVLERFGVPLDEFAAELNNRMTDSERPEGAVRLHEEFVRRR